MTISVGQSIAIIAVCVACTFLERALPFLLFGGRDVPKIVKYLGRILPMAVMATLVVYCLRGMTFDAMGNFLPQIIAVVSGIVCILLFGAANFILPSLLITVAVLCLLRPRLEKYTAEEEVAA